MDLNPKNKIEPQLIQYHEMLCYELWFNFSLYIKVILRIFWAGCIIVKIC